jgi:hypothetical protein
MTKVIFAALNFSKASPEILDFDIISEYANSLAYAIYATCEWL